MKTKKYIQLLLIALMVFMPIEDVYCFAEAVPSTFPATDCV
jgi:hypothetical protein